MLGRERKNKFIGNSPVHRPRMANRRGERDSLRGVVSFIGRAEGSRFVYVLLQPPAIPSPANKVCAPGGPTEVSNSPIPPTGNDVSSCHWGQVERQRSLSEKGKSWPASRCRAPQAASAQARSAQSSALSKPQFVAVHHITTD